MHAACSPRGAALFEPSARSTAASRSPDKTTQTPVRDELGDVVVGIESLFDAHAAGVIDLCPTLQQLLLCVLSILVNSQ